MEKHYIIKSVDGESYSELDFQIRVELFPERPSMEDDDGEYIDYVQIGDYDYGHPINIDTLIGRLQEMKGKGANYVSLDSHGDHIGYEMEAYHIKPATEEEIEIDKNKKAKKEENRRKERELLEQLNRLRKEE